MGSVECRNCEWMGSEKSLDNHLSGNKLEQVCPNCGSHNLDRG